MSNDYMKKYLDARKTGINQTTLLIAHKDKMYEVPTLDDFTLEQERKGSPAKLTFTVMANSGCDFVEGDPVRFRISRTWMFYGFVFTKKSSADGNIKVTAYDQMRYLKNKDTYLYSNKTATELIKMIAKDYNLNLGYIEDTKYKIAQRVEEDKSLMDIILNALDETLAMTRELYVFYDHAGKLALKNIKDMAFDLVIDNETIQDFDYESSIDSDVYNQIKLIYPNKDTGENEMFIDKDKDSVNQWGVLQFTKKIDSPVNAQVMTAELLRLYNKTKRQITLKDALGDVRVRPGTRIIVNLDLTDYKLKSYMIVESVKHKYKDGLYTMDLTVINKDFSASSYNQQANQSITEGNDKNDTNDPGGLGILNGKKVKARFSAYSAAADEGGFYATNGEKLNALANTCAAPPGVPFGTLIQIGGTGTEYDGKVYRVNDRGGKNIQKWSDGSYGIDLLMQNKSTCRKFGRHTGWIILGDGTGFSAGGSGGNSKAVALAKSKLGCPYKWAATGPDKFDCSGLMYWIAKQLGKSIPRNSAAQSRGGTAVAKGNLRPGDLVFFANRNGVHHVGMFIGNDKFIHAPQTGDVVKISTLSSRRDYHNSRRYF